MLSFSFNKQSDSSTGIFQYINNSSDQSSDEEKQNLNISSDDEHKLNGSSPTRKHADERNSPSSSPYNSSEDESKKIQHSVGVDNNNLSRKEFKKSPHLRKRVARNSLKSQLEMSKEKEALELEKEAKK